ncbi:MAG TPA: heparinase II/III family protein [Tepidisphaeraceae bacterium]|jgi:hypothetical protein
MVRLHFAALLIACLIPRSVTAAPATQATVQSRISDSLAPHPRLMLTNGALADLKQDIAKDTVLGSTWKLEQAEADRVIGLPPLQRVLEGKRLLAVSRECLSRVMHLSLAWRMTGDAKYLNRARDEMLNVCGFENWNPSHFLDVAEMTTALAIGYDWLYDGLSDADRATIRRAIVEKSIKPSKVGLQTWITLDNNWNQVCNGGMALGMLAIAEDEQALAAEIVTRSINGLPHAMKQYAPDGAYPEGPGYWSYGTTYNVMLIASLESALGTDFGLADAPGFLATADYFLHTTGPTGLYFNYSDCGQRSGPAPAMYWLAARRKQPWLLFNEQKLLKQQLAKARRNADQEVGRFGPLLLVWAAGVDGEITAPTATHWSGNGVTPVAVHRSGWGERAVYVAIKGGSPGASHAHMDAGTFVMDADGVRWADDLGPQDYNSLESKGIDLWNRAQGSQRWTVFRLSSYCHNILTVNGQQQRVGGNAKIVKSDESSTTIDLAPIYAGQLAAATRTITLRPDRSVLIQDDVRSTDDPKKSATRVRWAMLTRADVTLGDDNTTAILKRDGRSLRLHIAAPSNTKLQLYPTDPPHDYDAPNPGTRLIGFEVVLQPFNGTRLAVELIPGAGS